MFNLYFYIGQCAHDLTIENGTGSIQESLEIMVGWKKNIGYNLKLINYTFTILYMELQTYKHYLRWSSDQIRSKRSQCTKLEGTWPPSVLWWSRERWHSGKKASCSVGWVCLQLGDGTLAESTASCVFFPHKKNGICHVCNNHITSQPVLFILCIPKRYKRKKNSVKRRCFILYSLPLSIHGLKISILLVTMCPVSVKSYPASLNNKKTFSHTSRGF